MIQLLLEYLPLISFSLIASIAVWWYISTYGIIDDSTDSEDGLNE